MSIAAPRSSLWWILLIVLAVLAIPRLLAPRQLIPWRTDFPAARAEAARAGKPLFLDFTADWCGPCQSLKSTTWSNATVATALEKYIPVQIDIDAHPDLAAQYAVKTIPAFFVVDKDGHILKSNRDGAIPPQTFLNWLQN